MEQIGRLSFVPLLGRIPSDLDLDPLPSPEAVLEMLRNAFSPFFMPTADIETVCGGSSPDAPEAGVHVVYAYGHAWLAPDGPRCSSAAGDSSIDASASALIERLLGQADPERTVLFLDCCHAGAFEAAVASRAMPPRLTVFACAAEEKAIALNTDRTSRFSFALQRELGGGTQSLDVTRVVLNVADTLDRDGVIRGQHVSYRMSGAALRLRRGRGLRSRSRERTVLLVRNTFVAGGALIASCLGALGWFYWNHALVEIDLLGCHWIATTGPCAACSVEPTTKRALGLKR